MFRPKSLLKNYKIRKQVDTSKKRYISPEEKKIIDELRLLPKDKKDTSLQKEDNKLLMN